MKFRSVAFVCALPMLLVVACGSEPVGQLVAVPAAASALTATPTPVPAPTALPTPTPLPTATPLPTVTPEPDRLCVEDPEAYARRIAALEASVSTALDGYDGTFGFALYDLDCQTMATVNPDHRQYTASTGKLPFVIAALRAVQEERLEFADLERDLVNVLHHSSDDSANNIVAMVTPEEVHEVLAIAGVSGQTAFRDSWSNFYSTATDLTLVWVALLRGELLDDDHTELLLRLSAEAEVDRAYETFYSHFDAPGLVFGQKVGHAVIFAPPYYLVGSGYLRPDSGPSAGFAATLVLVADDLDPQRKDVFPVVLEFVEEALAEVAPG